MIVHHTARTLTASIRGVDAAPALSRQTTGGAERRIEEHHPTSVIKPTVEQLTATIQQYPPALQYNDWDEV